MKKGSAAVAALLALAGTAGPALAATDHGTVVSTSAVGTSSRQLYVQDMLGQDLTQLQLQNGVAKPFQVKVADANIPGTDPGFHVSAVMNNLYRVTGTGTYDFSHSADSLIPSQDITMGFPNPLSVSGTQLIDNPTATLSGTLPACSDAALLTTLQSATPTLTLTGLLAEAPDLCSGSIVGGLLSITGGALANPVDVAGLVVQTTLQASSTATDLTSQLFNVGGATGGTFDVADYANGIGVNDTNKPTSAATTSRDVVHGTALTSTSNLMAALGLDATTLGTLSGISSDGSGAITSVTNVLDAMNANATFQALAAGLTELAPAEQQALLDAYVTPTVSTALDTLTEVAGTYHAFPDLAVAVPTGLQTGSYAGTLTVTMVEP